LKNPHSLTRRQFLHGASLTALTLLGVRSLADADAAPTVVSTPSGQLSGLMSGGARAFLGVPFAQPPVGPLRFKPPIKAAPWTGVRDATQFGPEAMQPGAGHQKSEDCLYLNVWAPESPGPHPVFLWVHGGGFTGGGTADPLFNGSRFARNGIVCVTTAYRLGVFGFLDAEELLGQNYAGSGNNGLIDIMAALQWIQDNIAAFGGDPSRVTVGGESAGAKLTDILMGVPVAQGLFHQAVSQSGGAERVSPEKAAGALADRYAAIWKQQTGMDSTALAGAPADLLITAQEELLRTWPQHFPLRPEVDGITLPRLPVETVAAGNTRGKRLLIGTNRDESALFIGPHPTGAKASDLGNISLDAFEKVFANYQTVYPSLTPEQLLIRAVTAEEYWVPSTRLLQAHLLGGGDAWLYRFDCAPSSGEYAGFAYHSFDLGFVWESKHVLPDPVEGPLARTMHLAWAAFIHGRSPSAPQLPAWPQYTQSNHATMILNAQSDVEIDPQKSELALWQGVM
jgi:para-nitrobenzyl esterase